MSEADNSCVGADRQAVRSCVGHSEVTITCHVLPGDKDGHLFSLFSGTPLSPTSLLALKLNQFKSAVSLLDVYCRKNNWLDPEYHLYSTPGLDRTLLLLYKVQLECTSHSSSLLSSPQGFMVLLHH